MGPPSGPRPGSFGTPAKPAARPRAVRTPSKRLRGCVLNRTLGLFVREELAERVTDLREDVGIPSPPGDDCLGAIHVVTAPLARGAIVTSARCLAWRSRACLPGAFGSRRCKGRPARRPPRASVALITTIRRFHELVRPWRRPCSPAIEMATGLQLFPCPDRIRPFAGTRHPRSGSQLRRCRRHCGAKPRT